MKPTISCKVYDEATFGDPNFIGYFEINLGFFSRVTKKQIITQLKKLEEKLNGKKGKKIVGDTVSAIVKDMEKEMILKASKESRNRNKNRNREDSVNSTSQSNTRMGRSDNHLYPIITKHKTKKDVIEASEKILQKLTEILKNNSINSVPKIQHTCKESEYLFEEDTDSEFDIEDDINDDEEKAKKDKSEKAEEKKLEKMKFVVMPQYKNDKNLIMDQLKKIKTKKPSKKDKRKTLEAMDEYDEEQNNLVTSGKKNKRVGKKVKLVEIKKPDMKYYRECGYDTISTKSKHYRLELNKPLEESQFKGKSEFQNLIIRKGKRINFDLNWFEKMLLKKKQNKTVGIYKGSTSCMSSNLLQRIGRLGLYDDYKEFDIPHSKQTWENAKIDKDILQKSELVTRIYVLDGVIFENYDIDSKSDPYVKIVLGEIEMDNKDEAITDQQRPIFNQRFE